MGEETLRPWMLAEGLWSRMRRRKAHRKRRTCRPNRGAGLRSGWSPNDNSKAKKRHFFNEAKRGTFLTRLDKLGRLD